MVSYLTVVSIFYIILFVFAGNSMIISSTRPGSNFSDTQSALACVLAVGLKMFWTMVYMAYWIFHLAP